MTKVKNENNQARETGSEVNEYLNLLNQLNLHPCQIVEQEVSHVDGSSVAGNNMRGSDNNVLSQTNHVQENYGVTGISGTGHTINIYQYPKELIEILDRIKEVVTTKV
jgi:hypothetical protein